jgi:glycosyltransferase involved in cell wall biosynthesis
VSPPGPSGPKVLLACDWFLKYTAGLARGLADADAEVLLLSRDHALEFGGDAGAMRDLLAAALGGKAGRAVVRGPMRDPAALPGLVRLCRQVSAWHPEVVHVQEGVANDVRLMLAAGLPSRRYALTVHDPTPHPGEAMAARWRRAFRRSLRRRASLVFVHSRVLAEELSATGDVEAPIEVVPHGIEVGETTPPPPDTSLLFFGRITHYKGLDTLLDAMPAVWESDPAARLVVAGEGEVPAHPLLSDPRVELRSGYLPDAEVPSLFAAATMVVLPYRQASQSGVGSQAKQFGRALVTTDVGGLPELVGEDIGRVVPAEDPGRLAAAILEVARTPGLAAKMGARAAASVAESGWDRIGRLTLDAYRRHLL